MPAVDAQTVQEVIDEYTPEVVNGEYWEQNVGLPFNECYAIGEAILKRCDDVPEPALTAFLIGVVAAVRYAAKQAQAQGDTTPA